MVVDYLEHEIPYGHWSAQEHCIRHVARGRMIVSTTDDKARREHLLTILYTPVVIQHSILLSI